MSRSRPSTARTTRTIVRVPDQPLHERVLDLASPLIDRLGEDPAPDDVRAAIDLAITFWNAQAKASNIWGTPRRKELNVLRRKMTGKRAQPGDVERFELLCTRWREKDLDIDPRRVDSWSLDIGNDGVPHLTCEMALPDGTEAEVRPRVGERIAIGGRFLDEVRVAMTSRALLAFPLDRHKGTLDDDGRVTIRTKMPVALALFADGVLHPKGGAPMELMVQGRQFARMVLVDLHAVGGIGVGDQVDLIFERATGSGS